MIIKRTILLFILFVLSIFNIRSQDYFVYEYYELTDRGYTDEDPVKQHFNNKKFYIEYTFVGSDIWFFNNYHQMNHNIHIYDIKPENHTNDYFYKSGNNGYRLEYENGEYSKYIVYSDNLTEENPQKGAAHINITDIGKWIFRKRTFINEEEYIDYLSIMNKNLTMNPLPIKLSYIKAEYNNDILTIKWTTESELNNKHYGIDISNDGYVWNEDILQVEGKGDSTIQSNYEYDILLWKYNYNEGEPIYIRLSTTHYEGEYKIYLVNIYFKYEEPIYDPIYVYYNLEGKVYDNEDIIKPNTLYIKRELRTGETIKIIKTI